MTLSNGKEISQHVVTQLNLHFSLRLPTEPGYYADGKWGIRIESVVVVREVKTPNNFGNTGYLGMERLTMVGFVVSIRFACWALIEV